jgi:hypothetical protein
MSARAKLSHAFPRPAGRLAAAALVLAWTSAAQLLWVVETPAPDAHTPASVRVILATGFECLAKPKTAPEPKQTPAPKSAPARSERAFPDGMTPSAPKAPCFRRALSGDLDVLALLAALRADGISAAVDALACGAAQVCAVPDGPGAPPQLAGMVSSHGPRPPPALSL